MSRWALFVLSVQFYFITFFISIYFPHTLFYLPPSHPAQFLCEPTTALKMFINLSKEEENVKNTSNNMLILENVNKLFPSVGE